MQCVHLYIFQLSFRFAYHRWWLCSPPPSPPIFFFPSLSILGRTLESKVWRLKFVFLPPFPSPPPFDNPPCDPLHQCCQMTPKRNSAPYSFEAGNMLIIFLCSKNVNWFLFQAKFICRWFPFYPEIWQHCLFLPTAALSVLPSPSLPLHPFLSL